MYADNMTLGDIWIRERASSASPFYCVAYIRPASSSSILIVTLGTLEQKQPDIMDEKPMNPRRIPLFQ